MKRLILLISIVVFVAACSNEPVPVELQAAQTPIDNLSIFYTADTRGYIEPCGCTGGTAGGIARRAHYLAENRPEHMLLVDAGDVTSGGRDWERIQFSYIVEGYEEMGYHAANVGHRELRLGLDGLLNLQSSTDLFISANLLGESGEPHFDPYRIVTIDGLDIGIIGVMAEVPPEDVPPTFSLISPADAISRVLPEVTEQSDFVVLLAFAPEDTMKALADQFYEIDVIIGGDVRQPAASPVEQNKSYIAYVTDKGKSIGRLDIEFDDESEIADAKNSIYTLYDDVPDDPAMAALVEEMKEVMESQGLEAQRDDEEGLSTI